MDYYKMDYEKVLAEKGLLEVFQKLKAVFIQGVEVTQAIQYYRSSAHLTDSADQGADNSVQLIAGKLTMRTISIEGKAARTISASVISASVEAP